MRNLFHCTGCYTSDMSTGRLFGIEGDVLIRFSGVGTRHLRNWPFLPERYWVVLALISPCLLQAQGFLCPRCCHICHLNIFITSCLSQLMSDMDSSKKKPSLPRLRTNIPLLEQSANASCNVLPLKTLPDANTPPVIMPERPVRTLALFKEDKPDEENIAPATRFVSDSMPIYVSQKNVDDSSVTKPKKLYYEGAFTTRGSHNSPKDRITYESVIVVELKTNTKVCDGHSCSLICTANSQIRRRKTHHRYCRISLTPLLSFTNAQRHQCW